LRGLSLPLRYLAYVAGALLVLLVAAGVGATAGVVFGGRPEWLTSGSGATEGTVSVKTGEAGTSKGAAVETPGDAQYADSGEANPDQNANAPANKSVFTHTATDANSRGDYTYISDPAIDGDPNAVVLVVQSTDRGNTRGASYDHNFGVWYEGVYDTDIRKWAIYNRGGAQMPDGAAFNIAVSRVPNT
jgi:hypothetical protein